jgi:hypothetical protein
MALTQRSIDFMSNWRSSAATDCDSMSNVRFTDARIAAVFTTMLLRWFSSNVQQV